MLRNTNLLTDLSVWLDDFVQLLDDWSGDGVHSDMGLIGGGGLLVAAGGTLVGGLDVDGRRLGAHSEVEWLATGWQVNGEGLSVRVAGGHIVEGDSSAGVDGTGHHATRVSAGRTAV